LKVKQIDTIILSEPLWIEEFDNTINIESEVVRTINGSVLVWERQLNNRTINYTLSNEDSWQEESVKNLLVAHKLASIGTEFNIVLTDNSTVKVRYRHEVGNAVETDRIIKSNLSSIFRCKIYLARTE